MPYRSYANLTEAKIVRLRDGLFALVGRQTSNKGTALRGEESMSHNGRHTYQGRAKFVSKHETPVIQSS